MSGLKKRRVPESSRASQGTSIYVVSSYKLREQTDFCVRRITRKIIKYTDGSQKVEYDGRLFEVQDHKALFPQLRQFREEGSRVVQDHEGGHNFRLNSKLLPWISAYSIENSDEEGGV